MGVTHNKTHDNQYECILNYFLDAQLEEGASTYWNAL